MWCVSAVSGMTNGLGDHAPGVVPSTSTRGLGRLRGGKSRMTRSLHTESAVRIVARDVDIGVSTYHAPQGMSRELLEALHFADLARRDGHVHSSASVTRLARLARIRFLN